MTSLRKRRLPILLLIGVTSLAFVAAACGGDDSSNNSNSTTTSGSGGSSNLSSLKATLQGSGSTFQANFNSAAIAGFQSVAPGVKITYGGGGSGKGKTDLANEVVDFAGTDSLIKPEDQSKYTKNGGVLYFPTVAAPITISYNLSGVDTLKLDAPTLAKIFQGDIKTWDDPAIKALNSGVNLPSTSIVVAHRADASGTTSNFSKYLDAASGGVWKLGASDTISWPSGTQAGTGNAGVAQIVKSTPGAIGYVDYSDATASGLKFAQIKNKSGKYVPATLDGAAAAVSNATIKPDLTYSPLDSPGADAYPITSPTWILVWKQQTNKAKGDAMKAFLNYILTDGQKLASQAQYAPLPSSLAQKGITQLGQLQIG